MLAALVSVATTIGIIVALLRPALDFFPEVPSASSWAAPGGPQRGDAPSGVWPPSVHPPHHPDRPHPGRSPSGWGPPMYLSEYASKKTRARLKPMVELLAGIPSVVYGFFARPS